MIFKVSPPFQGNVGLFSLRFRGSRIFTRWLARYRTFKRVKQEPLAYFHWTVFKRLGIKFIWNFVVHERTRLFMIFGLLLLQNYCTKLICNQNYHKDIIFLTYKKRFIDLLMICKGEGLHSCSFKPSQNIDRGDWKESRPWNKV